MVTVGQILHAWLNLCVVRVIKFCSVHSYEEAVKTNMDRIKQVYLRMLVQGVYLAPSGFEAGFAPAAHDSVINKILERFEKFF